MLTKLLKAIFSKVSESANVNSQKFERFHNVREGRKTQRLKQSVDDITTKRLSDRRSSLVAQPTAVSFSKTYQPPMEITLGLNTDAEYQTYRIHPLDELQRARRLDSVVYSTKFFKRKKSA